MNARNYASCVQTLCIPSAHHTPLIVFAIQREPNPQAPLRNVSALAFKGAGNEAKAKGARAFTGEME